MQHDDPGAVDASIPMLFGSLTLLLTILVIFEAATFWHARNVFDEAAAEGARVAAAFDGSCTEGTEAATRLVRRTAGSWADGIEVSCTDGTTVSITVSGRTPGVLGQAAGFTTSVTESAPKER
ncbi:MAG: TadE/TadG family type IV pilus assembly protein [Actinomycetota bacterium]|nr:TadE/TadG family type IV pilus assembly protein [Actinomycetota bacterium]